MTSEARTMARADRLVRLFKRRMVEFRDLGLTRQLIEDSAVEPGSIVVDGRRLSNFGLCSYLSIGQDPRVKEAAIAATRAFGTAYSSSVGYTALPLYGTLTERLEEVFSAKVVLAGTTTLAHLAALPVMIRRGDVVFVDAQVHNSVTTVAQTLMATGIPVSPIPHNDASALEEAVGENSGRRVWFLTDGVFSMRGDTAPAERIGELLDRHSNLHVYCDEAHGFGWDGDRGEGQYLRRAGWHERLVVVTGLSKAFGTLGGAVATVDEELADLITLTGPSLAFGGPIPPPNLGASVAAADIFLSGELSSLQARLFDRIDHVNASARKLGISLRPFERTPLWFNEVGDLDTMKKLALVMRDKGFYLNTAAFPVVPHGQAGLRFTVTLDNDIGQIEDLLAALRESRMQVLGETGLEIDLTEQAEPAEGTRVSEDTRS